MLQEWAIRQVQNEMPGYFTNARTIVLGADHARTVRVLREFTDNIDVRPAARRPGGPAGLGPAARRGRRAVSLADAPGPAAVREDPCCRPS